MERTDNCSNEQMVDLGRQNSVTFQKRELSGTESRRLQRIIDKFEDVFGETAGGLKELPVGVLMKQDARPVFSSSVGDASVLCQGD